MINCLARMLRPFKDKAWVNRLRLRPKKKGDKAWGTRLRPYIHSDAGLEEDN